MASTALPARSDAAEHLKAVALRLFAQRGIDGVTVRQIAAAAGQKNHAVVGYYFGSKEDLIRAVIVDGARRIDDQRNAWLDAVEAAGGPRSVGEVIEGLVRTSLDPDPPEWGECYNRFVVGLGLAHRMVFMDALEGRWNSGYQRCFEHVRQLMPRVARKELNQRLLFMGSALGAILAAREAELADRSRPHPTWSADATLTRIARSLTAMVEIDD
ncbi:TetR family transcriptional regulator [Novosphingobium aquiterrae]|uniref:TetR family transcriptional regulator n=1 Tax=Novosphingobium aquiterrae TaxID=624388 RepID=A0ABV6PHR9_9SPHN